MDILDKLEDLHKQATVDRSHYYTGSLIREAIEEIADLRRQITSLKLQRMRGSLL